MYLWTCGSFASVNHKKIGSENRNPARCHVFVRSANLTNIFNPANLRLGFAELMGVPPTFAFYVLTDEDMLLSSSF
jgi:hypothetical protein